jgi:selenocysteine lyase/cysteine desulfurase
MTGKISDPTDLREQIPALDDVVYFNTGASGPSTRSVVAATRECQERHAFESPAREGMYEYAFGVFDETRERVAALLGTDAERVALTQSTTDGINRIATAVDWSPGDTVVTTDVEHHSGRLPWRRLADTRGVSVEVVPTDDRGRLDMDAMAAAVEDATLVSLSAVDWGYGRQLPVEEVVEMAHDAGARVLVDAVQAVGQQPVDVTDWGADFVAAAGHKWLLGPWGAGFLYVRDGAESWLRPDRIGYRGVEEPTDDDYTYLPGARRLEVATVNPSPYAGLRVAIDDVERVGLPTITSRVERLTDRLKAGLDPAALLSPREYHTGLVSFSVPNPDDVVERLDAAGLKLRTIPSLPAVRASVHAFNTAGDVDRLLDVLADVSDVTA